MMKKKIRMMTLGLISSICFVPSVWAECGKSENDALIKITNTNKETKYCDKDFSDSVEDGDVVTVLKEINLTNNDYIMAKAAKKYTIDLNKKTISSTGSLGAMYIAKGTVELKNGTIKREADSSNVTLMVYSNSTVTISNINVINAGKGAAIQIGSGGEENSTNTLIVKSGSVVTGKGYGISLESSADSDNAILKVNGGEITATEGLAISGNANTTKHGEITISNGKISGPQYAAIYQPYVGNITITGGEISGKIGILARQGTVNVSGGTIIGTSSDSEKVGIGAEGRDLTPGTAIIVDNGTTGSYPEKSNVNITGGTFKATADKTIESYENNTTDFVVTGGEYDKQFNNAFIQNNKAEVQVGSTYYVGNDAKKAVENAQAGTTVTVLQGNLTTNNVKEGVTVENKGTGTVKVNEVEIKQDENYTTPVTSHNTGSESKEKDYTITENVTYADNGEDIIIEGSIVTEKTETTEAIKETYDKMVDTLKERGYTEIFNMYEFHVKDNKSLTKLLTITFDLGEKNNGRVAYILHQKHDGSYEEFENTVENGKVSITVSELSPFVVALKDKEEKKDPVESTENNAQTASINVVTCGILTGISLIGVVTLGIKMRKAKEAR